MPDQPIMLSFADVTICAHVAADSPLGEDDELHAAVTNLLLARSEKIVEEAAALYPGIRFTAG